MPKPREFIAKVRDWLRSPTIGFFMLFLGLATAGVYSTYLRDDFQIVKGAEMALLAVTRFIVLGQITSFFQGLMIVGVGTPVVMGLISPLFYYSRSLKLAPFLEMSALGLLPGLGLLFLGWKGLQIHRRHLEVPTSVPIPESIFTPWLPWVENACEFSLWLMIATLMEGHWNEIAVASVAIGSLTLVFSLFVLVGAKTTLDRRDIGTAILIAGILTIITSIVIVVTQGNRCTEAVLGVPPGILLVVIGFSIRISGAMRKSLPES